MRPQARVLIAVGAVVLAAVVALVLIPRGEKAPSSTPSGLTLSPPVIPPAATTETGDGPSTMSVEPFTPPTSTTGPGTSWETMSTTAPAPRANSTDPWDTALNEGRRPSQTDNAFGGRVDRGPATPNNAVSPVGVPGTHTAWATPRSYTVQAGDSLYTISQKILGSPKYVAAIQKANPKVDARRLRVGQVLNMPDLSGSSTPAPAAGVSRPVADGGLGTAPGLSGGKTYKVQPGDTLRKIATKHYGNSKMWEKIYALNREAIGSSPSNLRSGMVLRMPEGATRP